MLNKFRKDKCSMQGCNEPRKKDGLLPSAFCPGHWYINVVQPTLNNKIVQESRK